jgi:hypothetical protein
MDVTVAIATRHPYCIEVQPRLHVGSGGGRDAGRNGNGRLLLRAGAAVIRGCHLFPG